MFISNRQTRLWVNRISQLTMGRPIAFPPIPADGTIRFYKRDRPDFGFLSNFYVVPVEIEGVTWPHTEAFYQSRKSKNPDYHARILEREKPSWAKYVGDSRLGSPNLAKQSWFRDHPHDLRADWEQVKLDVMRMALHAKFNQHVHLLWSLIATGAAEIVEDSNSDDFWGAGKDGLGQNWLGRLLMDLRKRLEVKDD